MANANFWLDEMDSCPTHGIDAMRHTPVDGETPRNLDHWNCAECDFNAGSIDWVARMRPGGVSLPQLSIGHRRTGQDSLESG